jgi:HemY protein
VIRVVIYLALIGLLALGAEWLADRPGDVTIHWLGHQIETSVMVLAMAVAAVAVLAVALWTAASALLRSPNQVGRHLRARRGARGYRSVSQGLVAVGSGDAVAARKFMEEASRIAPGEPLTLLLQAQTAQLAGDRAGAVRSFEQMAGREDTRLLGLHGLFVEARRRNDAGAALLHAEEAARHDSVPGWAGRAVFEFRCIAGDWPGALHRLEHNIKSRLLDKTTYQRQRAVLLTAQAIAAEDADRNRARELALEATKLAPGLVPAAALAGRLLAEAGDTRRAGRIVEAAWRLNPHPDLADAYAYLRPGDSARERLARIETLAGKAPGNVEAALAVARAALDAQEFAVARAALTPLAITPTRRVAALMAELEQKQHGDEGRAREWMKRALLARRDPAWTADGFVSDRWLPVSPVTGRLDAFEWKDPLAGDHVGTLIEAEETGTIEAPRREVVPTAVSRQLPESIKPAEIKATEEVTPPAAVSSDSRDAMIDRESHGSGNKASSREPRDAAPQEASLPALSRGQRRARARDRIALAPAVIPLVHAPDDPGPDPETPLEPRPETTDAPADNWSRLRHLFRH